MAGARGGVATSSATAQSYESKYALGDEYQIEDKIVTLDCQLEFHRDCIKDWLLMNNICPICRRPALGSESSTN
ncbi:hypothetical protein Sjap_008422 [Stephania japonica]|uniref:RING-type E3 ubiquitin transferase n=1 Tax=Stephania japonica TaxID=461633 RepID=A0AAP0PAV3_9MAGN